MDILPPSSFGQSQAVTGFNYVYTGEKVRQEITERLNVLQMGLAEGIGDLAGSGSNVLRISRYGGIGYAETMTALGESGSVPTTGNTLNNDTVTIGRYGLGKEQTYQEQILGRAETLHLEDMARQIPDSWVASLRLLVMQNGATFAQTGGGTTGTALTYDDMLALVAAFHETEGFEVGRGVMLVLHPEQYTDLRASIRNEPGLQNDTGMSLGFQTLGGGSQPASMGNFLGFTTHSSFDVVSDSTDFTGFAYVPGAIAWVRASTLRIEPEDPARTVYVPEFGIIIERKATSEEGVAKLVANAWFGVDTLSSTLFPQFKVISADD